MINNVMNYKKHYETLINRACDRIKSPGFEQHHIIPRCMGGTDEKDNLVFLTHEEHYVAHLLLIKIYPNEPKLVYAANMMTVDGGTVHRTNNKAYGWLKRRYSEVCKQRVGTNNPSYGRKWFYDPETLQEGKFLQENIPEGWVPGRNTKITKTCDFCKEKVVLIGSKFCSPKCKKMSKSEYLSDSTKVKEAKEKTLKIYKDYCERGYTSVRKYVKETGYPGSSQGLSALFKKYVNSPP